MPVHFDCIQCWSNIQARNDDVLHGALDFLRDMERTEELNIDLRVSRELQSMIEPPAVQRLGSCPVSHSLQKWLYESEDKNDFIERSVFIAELHEIGCDLKSSAVKINGDLTIHNYNFSSLPDNLTVYGKLIISECSRLASLPEGLKTDGGVSIFSCPALTSIETLGAIRGPLTIDDCSMLKHMPSCLQVAGNLTVENCPSLEAMPEILSVHGHLSIKSCNSLEGLNPERGFIGGQITIDSCERFSSISSGPVLGGHIKLVNTPSFNRIPAFILNLSSITNESNRTVPRRITFFNTGLPEAEITSLLYLNNSESHFITSAYQDVDPEPETDDDSDVDMSGMEDDIQQIVTTSNSEAEDLLKILKDDPQAEFHIAYLSSEAQDSGGLTKNALTNAFFQTLNSKQSPFNLNSENKYILIDAPADNSIQNKFDQAINLGILLGHMAEKEIHAGHIFEDSFFSNLQNAYEFQDDAYDEVHQSSKKVAGIICTLHDSTDASILVPLITEILPAKFQSQQAKDYLKTVDMDELRSLVFETGCYLSIAHGMAETCFFNVCDDENLKDLIAGPSNLKQNVIDNITFHKSENRKLFTTERQYKKPLLNWCKKVVQDANNDELSFLLQNVTGSVSTDEAINVGFGVFNNKHMLYGTSTCGNVLRINAEEFKSMYDANNYEAFKSGMLFKFELDFNGI